MTKIISLSTFLEVLSQRVASETLTRPTYVEELSGLPLCKITLHVVIIMLAMPWH